MNAPALQPRACGPDAWRRWGRVVFKQGLHIKPSVWLAWVTLCAVAMALSASGMPGWGAVAALVPWIQGAWLHAWRSSLSHHRGLVLEQLMSTLRQAPKVQVRVMWSFVWGLAGMLLTLQPVQGWEGVGWLGVLLMSLALFFRLGGPMGLVEDLEARFPLRRLQALQANLAAWRLNAVSIACQGLAVLVLVMLCMVWPPLCLLAWPLSVGLRHAAYLDIFEQLPNHASQTLTWRAEPTKIN